MAASEEATLEFGTGVPAHPAIPVTAAIDMPTAVQPSIDFIEILSFRSSRFVVSS